MNKLDLVEQWLIDNPEGGRASVVGRALGITGKDGAGSRLRDLVQHNKAVKILDSKGTRYVHFNYAAPLLCSAWPSPVLVPKGGKRRVYNLLDR